MKILLTVLSFFLVYAAFVYAGSDSTYSKEETSFSGLSLQMYGINTPSSLEQVRLSDFNPLERKVNEGELLGLGAVYLGVGIGVHIYQRNAWWSSERTSFHFQNDWSYALSLDKVGHFYAATFLAHLFTSGLEAGNIQSEPAAVYGSLAGLAFQLYVEIEDGFGAQWGFSPGDAYADVLGSGYSLAQYYYPFLKNFKFKFSYYPSLKMREGLHKGNAIDDDEGQKYWLSFRVKNLLPQTVSNYWPSFLAVAVGMGVQNLDGNGGGQRTFYIALDLDAEQIPLYGKGWQFLKNTLDYIHFPMPGIRISPTGAFFVFCF
jgi:hypothetical protein